MKTSNRSRASLVRRIGGGRRGEHLHALPQIGVGRLWSEESVERLVNVSWDLADLWGEERKGRRGEHLHAERLVNVGWDLADHRLDDSSGHQWSSVVISGHQWSSGWDLADH